jgi:hypothetical protein
VLVHLAKGKLMDDFTYADIIAGISSFDDAATLTGILQVYKRADTRNKTVFI